MDEIKKLQVVFQTLADYNRLSIIRALCARKECSVGEIVAYTKLSQPLVSHHLKVLKGNDILKTKRQGPFIFYSLKDEKIPRALDLFLEIFKDSDIEPKQKFSFCAEMMFNKTKK